MLSTSVSCSHQPKGFLYVSTVYPIFNLDGEVHSYSILETLCHAVKPHLPILGVRGAHNTCLIHIAVMF